MYHAPPEASTKPCPHRSAPALPGARATSSDDRIAPQASRSRPAETRRSRSRSIVRCPHEGTPARGAAPLASPLRRRLRWRRVRPGRAGLRRPPGAALPALARARSIAAVRHLDLGLEPGLVGRLPGAPVLPARLRAPRGRAPGGAPLATVGRNRLSPPVRRRLPRPRRDDLRAPRPRGRRSVARAAARVPGPRPFRGPPRRCGGRAPVGHAHDTPGAGLAASPRAGASPVGRRRATPALGAASRRPGAPVPPVHAPVGGRAPRPRDGAGAARAARSAHRR